VYTTDLVYVMRPKDCPVGLVIRGMFNLPVTFWGAANIFFPSFPPSLAPSLPPSVPSSPSFFVELGFELGFSLAKQAVYRLSHPFSPFYSGYFGDGALTKTTCLG
jgi:hypothetical protein